MLRFYNLLLLTILLLNLTFSIAIADEEKLDILFVNHTKRELLLGIAGHARTKDSLKKGETKKIAFPSGSMIEYRFAPRTNEVCELFMWPKSHPNDYRIEMEALGKHHYQYHIFYKNIDTAPFRPGGKYCQ